MYVEIFTLVLKTLKSLHSTVQCKSSVLVTVFRNAKVESYEQKRAHNTYENKLAPQIGQSALHNGATMATEGDEKALDVVCHYSL